MKQITMFQCEICNGLHETKSDALTCEGRGKQVPLVEIGKIIDYEIRMGGGFDSFYIPLRVSKIEDLGHYLVYHFEEYDEVGEEWFEFSHTAWGNNEFIERVIVK